MTTTINNINNAEISSIAKLKAFKANQKTKLNTVNETREKIRKENRQKLVNDTLLAMAIASNGYVGTMGLTIAGDTFHEPQVRQTDKSNKVSSMTTIGYILQQEYTNPNGKKNIIIYAQDTEARRFGGFLNTIKSGSDEVFSEKATDWAMSHTDMGQKYIDVATQVFTLTRKMIDEGYTIRVSSTNNITTMPLDNRTTNGEYFTYDENLANKTAEFHNGVAIVNGRRVKARGFALSGSHKLVMSNGILAIERKISEEKTPEQYYANEMRTILANEIAIARETAEADEGIDDLIDEACA